VVLTGAVRSHLDPPRVRRRSVLVATGAAVTLAGCTKPRARPAAEVIAADPLGPLYQGTVTLIATYDATLTSTPALAGTAGPLREEHRQHLIALAALIGVPAPPVPARPDATPAPPSSLPPSRPPIGNLPSTSPSDSATGSGDLIAARVALSNAEKSAQLDAVTACLAATTNRIAVLASIAASRAAHVAVLR
jgi:hypothetical protein